MLILMFSNVRTSIQMFLLKITRGDRIHSVLSTSIMSSSEEETSPVKRRAFKAHRKDKAKQEKATMIQEVVDNKMPKKGYYKREKGQRE